MFVISHGPDEEWFNTEAEAILLSMIVTYSWTSVIKRASLKCLRIYSNFINIGRARDGSLKLIRGYHGYKD